jgi:Tol biopolymer transport system component
MRRRWIVLLGMAAAIVFAGGCNDFNTTIGTPSNSTTISALSPTGVNAGAGGFTLYVLGSSFTNTSVVQWNGSTRVTTYLSADELGAQILASDLTTPQTANIQVYTPGTAQSDPLDGINVIATSNVLQFTIQAAPPPLPVITSVSPASEVAGSVALGSTFTLRVLGTGFATGSLVYWNGSQVVSYTYTPQTGCVVGTANETTYVSATEVDASVSGCLIQTAGTERITVFNPATGTPPTGGGSSNTWSFSVTSAGGGNARTEAAMAGAAAATTLSPATSADTRYVAFAAPVPDPTADASTGTDNIYVRDTCTGAPAAANCTPATTLISVAADGTSAADAASESPSISADGRYVAFVSLADNLVAGGASGFGDIYVRDTCTGAPAAANCTPATTLISLAPDGSLANGASDSPSISASGRYVVFSSLATNLVAGTAASSQPQIYLRDLCVGAAAGCQVSTTQISISSSSAANSAGSSP